MGEPIFGRPARDMSMARVLQQLFETTKRFEMQAQPQLLLLQKSMVVVEGVARALDPDFDIWIAARPVVERFMIERLSPQARLREVGDGLKALGRALPQFVRNTEAISRMLADGGLKLHPDTARQIAEAQPTCFIGVWLLAAAAIIGAVLWRVL